MVCNPGLGGWGYSGFQVTGIIEWGHQNPKKSLGLQTNPQKIPGPKFNPPKMWAIKIYLQNYAAGICGNYHESSDGFEYPQKIPTRGSSYPKKYLPNFPTPKKTKIQNFKPQKSFDHPCHLKSGVSPLGSRVVKSSRLPGKIATYLVSIGRLLCLAFLYRWCFLNKNIPWLATYFNNSAIYFKNFWQPWGSALSPTNCIAVFPCYAIK